MSERGKATAKKLKRVTMVHPKMKGEANVLEADVKTWADEGWTPKDSAQNAD